MYEPLLPFTPHAEFVVLTPFNIDGVDLTPGTTLPKAGLNSRLLRQLYEQRRIGVAGPDYSGLPAPAVAPLLAPSPVDDSQAAAPVTKAAAHPVDPTSTPPAYRIKQAGLGGFKVLDAKGQLIGQGHKTKAEAEAAIAALIAAKE
jgi:hypothetical protein